MQAVLKQRVKVVLAMLLLCGVWVILARFPTTHLLFPSEKTNRRMQRRGLMVFAADSMCAVIRAC